MKKFFAFVLVMAMAAIVNASPATNYVLMANGEVAGDVIAPGSVISMTTAGTQQSAYTVELIADGVTFDVSGISFPTAMQEMDFAYWGTNGASTLTATSILASGIPMSVGATVKAGADLFRGLVVEGQGTFTVTDKDTGAVATYSVPEPMTMSLLGLGGLVAARRRRA